jgi:poly-gamma-glutamate capsule biosynthesis protein CapA/YwtB (metallophosphatase superfamily)
MRRRAGVFVTALALLAAPAVHAAQADPAPPPITLAMGVHHADGDGTRLGCLAVSGACTQETRRGLSLRVATNPTGVFTGSRLRLERSWREPGTRRLQPLAPYRVTMRDGTFAASIPLGRVLTEPGLWCFRAVIDTVDGRRIRSPLRCVRWSPPIEIGWAGDTVVGSSYGLPPFGGILQLAQVTRLLQRPDLMIGNYEGTLSRGGSSRCSGGPLCYIFQAPPERARNLAVAGFDVMNLANNHALDKGENARRQTIAALERVGIAAAGMPGAVTVVQVRDTRVAIIGFSPYPGTTNMRSTSAIRALVKRADRVGDVVVVAFHAGLEGAAGAHVPMGADYGTNTRAALHAAVDAGADVVFGSGPHVVRGVERRRGAFIVYSSGNFAGWHNFALGGFSSQSGVVRVTFRQDGSTIAANWDAVKIGPPGIPRPDRSGQIIRRVAGLSRADFGRSAARFDRRGRFR